MWRCLVYVMTKIADVGGSNAWEMSLISGKSTADDGRRGPAACQLKGPSRRLARRRATVPELRARYRLGPHGELPATRNAHKLPRTNYSVSTLPQANYSVATFLTPLAKPLLKYRPTTGRADVDCSKSIFTTFFRLAHISYSCDIISLGGRKGGGY